ncbi:uncharacterized protein NECHADRAFT_80249 [Fusarium vanettenii 77-13-4]|uniref:Bacteriophage T5 Orf172 DNA-binding domain-containing protein n=1 Tax=Fusarium vanettenii (strain ATCC MYA-4622 / CBS 123669 / FGSC 9596 / NRRL 45880 / 77-13-4) TaxID=660122 RepID=C7YTB8_FUSV7|nr:uncharacterized protein NECHADRAFT_80249 [Fusarium vanettenii 77-13-4]EEU45385.1 hypothetical protein NECHADRAFT_80249 [Fusarium vanettenii 77-13-4]
MATSPSVTTWPATASALRELLGMDACHSMTCHGKTQKKDNPRCTVIISKKDCNEAAKLLDQIVELGSFKAAQSILSDLAYLIMCKNKRIGHGDKFGPSQISKWRVKLESIPIPSVENEEQEEDASSEDEAEDDSPTPPLSVWHSDSETDEDTSTQEDTPDLASQTPPSTSDSRKTTKETKIVHKFERYSIVRSTTFINKKIRKLLLRPLLDREKQVDGYIYTYTFPESYHDAAPYLKIGYAKDVQARMSCWERQCRYRPKVLVQQSADHYVKIEGLVHAQLINQRKVEATGCPVCSVRHNEWFSASSLDASRAVSLWASWMRQMPYDEEGQLKSKWKARIEGLDMSDAACWEELVNAIYVDDEDDLSEEDEFQWSTDDESHHSAEEYEIYESEDEYGDKSGSDDEEE